jgi:hypothetical protein
MSHEGVNLKASISNQVEYGFEMNRERLDGIKRAWVIGLQSSQKNRAFYKPFPIRNTP